MLSNCLKRIGGKSSSILRVVARKYSAVVSKDFKIELPPFKVHGLEDKPLKYVNLTKEHALVYYTQMYRIRRIETVASSLYTEKIVRGFLHLYAGQEAVAVGIKSVMKLDDNIITAYRCHGYALLQGISQYELLAELSGREGGACRGKGGSMHLFGHHFYGGNGIVGAQIPVGCGVALALKYKQAKNVIFACHGEGAANQGQIYEAYNMASLWKLPVIFVCENNEYGMGTSAVRASASAEYYTRGTAALIPGIFVDGMDVLAVKEAARYAHEHCLSGKGPIIMEAHTYRYYGHSMSDPGTSYRSRDEIDEVRKSRDPITSFRDLIIKQKIATKDELKGIEVKIKQEIDAALKKTKESPEPAVPELAFDVYANPENIPTMRFKLPDQTLPIKRHGKILNA